MTSSDTASNDSGSQVAFSDFDLNPLVFKAIETIGYEVPTPIQAQSIPHLLKGGDILGVAQTGTGKTAAFALPMLSRINLKQRNTQLLCLAPTRELAIQVAEAFKTYAKHLEGFSVLPIYGGTDYQGQIRALKKGLHVVVGTPGRVMDHIRRGTLKLNNITSMVLDEADEMLKMGFIDDIEWILEQLPEQRQTALFSATMPKPIRKISQKYLTNPEEINIKENVKNTPKIRQRYLILKNNQKLDSLTRILDVEETDGMIIFVRTRNATVEVSDRLQARGHAAAALNGDIAQNQREKTVARLKKGEIDIIVATDVAARGLDVERISHVVNYDIPYDTESYVHRIGRTGRAGREGDAIIFITGREKHHLKSIEKITHSTITPYTFPSAAVINERKVEQLFNRIDQELQKDLKEYIGLMKKYIEQNDHDPALVAAALASMEHDSKPFYVKLNTHTQPNPRDRNTLNDEGRKKKQRNHERSESDDFNLDFETYRLEVGTEHEATKGDIVGAIANEAGLDSQHIGKIHIFENHSTIELPEGMPKSIFNDLKKTRVRGTIINISKESGHKTGRKKPSNKPGNKPGKKPRKRPASNNAGRSSDNKKRTEPKSGNQSDSRKKPRKKK